MPERPVEGGRDRFHAREGHLPAAGFGCGGVVFGGDELGGDDGALDEGCAGGEGLDTFEAEAAVVLAQAQRFCAAGVPDSGEHAVAGVLGEAFELFRRAVAGDEEDPVDVAFEDAAEGEIGAAGNGEEAQEGGVAARLCSQTEPAVRRGQWGGERPDGGKALQLAPGSSVEAETGARRQFVCQLLSVGEETGDPRCAVGCRSVALVVPVCSGSCQFLHDEGLRLRVKRTVRAAEDGCRRRPV